MDNYLLPQSHKGHKESQRFSVNNDNLDKENMLSKMIVDCAYKVHTTLGPGLLESAYHEGMIRELTKRSISFRSEYKLPIWYDGVPLETKYQVDLLVDDCVIVELKSAEKIIPVYEAQTLTYLKLSGLRLALLINFSSPLIKDGIKRFVN